MYYLLYRSKDGRRGKKKTRRSSFSWRLLWLEDWSCCSSMCTSTGGALVLVEHCCWWEVEVTVSARRAPFFNPLKPSDPQTLRPTGTPLCEPSKDADVDASDHHCVSSRKWYPMCRWSYFHSPKCSRGIWWCGPINGLLQSLHHNPSRGPYDSERLRYPIYRVL